MESDLHDLGRWAELPSYLVSLDAPDARLDGITELAVKAADADIGGISLIFQAQIWMPSRYGIEPQYLPRSGSFCTWAVENGAGEFEVEDASADPRFSPNPLVAAGPGLRHYAGIALHGQGGHLIGTLWVMSRQARRLEPGQWAHLRLVAGIAAETLASRYCDDTTGMYNRTVFLHHLQCVLERSGRGAQVAVGYLNLAGFRGVNDVHGRPAGNGLLRAFGARLAQWAGPSALLGHLGGDQFAFALTGTAAEIGARIDGLRGAIDAAPDADDGAAPQLRARIGLWRQDLPHLGDASEVLDAAETAAAAIARTCPHSEVREYDSALKAGSRLRYELDEVIRGAGRYGRLEVHYQPQVDIGGGGLVGLEALVRWRHPQYGLVGPGRFIPQAEASCQIVDLDLHVLSTVCADLAAWIARGLEPVPVALNLSRASLLHPRTLPRLGEVLAASGVPGRLLEFEITESLLLDSLHDLQQRVAALRALGVRIAIDDFGTGYSNLDALNDLHFDRLKADRRFVDGVAANPKKAGLFLLIKGIAELSGAELLCEGLERHDDLLWLRSQGALRVQGWYFSAARPAAAVETWLERFAQASRPLPVEALRTLLD